MIGMTLFWLSSTRPSHNTSLSPSLALWIWPNGTFSHPTLFQPTSDLTLSGGVTKSSQSAWWNWQCAMTLFSMKLRPGRQTNTWTSSLLFAMQGTKQSWSQSRWDHEASPTWVGLKAWGRNWNWRKPRPMTLWSKQLGEQCWAHLVYGAVETKLISSSVFVSSLCKALLVLSVVWSQVMCAMFL